MPSTTEDWAYLAGIIDGEGTIRYEHVGARDHGRWIVAVVNTDPNLLGWLCAIGGGMHRAGGTHKPCWKWSVTRRADTFELLSGVYPYLRVKRAKAEAALQFLARVRETVAPPR